MPKKTQRNIQREEDRELDQLEEKSRSQIKREMEALQKIGLKVCQLNHEQRLKVPMSEELRQAIDTYLRIKSNEAKRRQLQFIGKLMRSEDEQAIQAQLDLYDSSSRAHNQFMQQVEDWRSRLIGENNEDLSEWIRLYPETDIQGLRALIRQARKDIQSEKQTGAAKKIFRLIKETLDQHRS